MLRSNTAHLQSEDKSAEPPQEQRPRRRVTKKEEDSHLPLFSYPEPIPYPALKRTLKNINKLKSAR